MKDSLKNFLKERCGLSEAEVEKIAAGERPDDGKALRKSTPEDPYVTLARLEPNSPALEKIAECHALLEGIGGIRDTIDRILKGDREREARDRGIELFNKGMSNGFPSANTMVAALAKNRGDMR